MSGVDGVGHGWAVVFGPPSVGQTGLSSATTRGATDSPHDAEIFGRPGGLLAACGLYVTLPRGATRASSQRRPGPA